MWTGRILSALAFMAWMLLFWLSLHQSKSPDYFGRYSSEYLLFLGFILAGVLALTVLAYLGVRHPDILHVEHIGGALLLLLGSIVVSLLAAELFVRSVDLFGISLFEEATKYIMDLEADKGLVYKHRAGLDTVYQGVAFRTNEIGLRDRPLQKPGEDVLPVLILGDSVTLGWGVPMENTFSYRLETELHHATKRPVRTINSGVSGYNTEQELIFLKRYVESMAPKLVILVYVENDIEPEATDMLKMQYLWNHPPGANATLLRWSWLYRIIYYVVPDLITSPSVPKDKRGWKRSMEALKEINRVSVMHGAKLAVYLYRMRHDDVTDALNTDISRIAGEQKFSFFDMLPWFKKVRIRSVTNSFIDSHPNMKGHRIIADGIMRTLRESGLLCQSAAALCSGGP